MSDQPARSLERRTARAARAAIAAFLGAKCALFVALALSVRWVMDELYQGGFSVHVGEFYRAFDPIKTVLFAYFFLPARWLASDSVELMHVARLEAAGLGLALVALAALLARRLGLGGRESALAAVVLVSFSTFMERGFGVRSDTLAVALGFAAWWVALGGASRLRLLGAGALLGASFCSTQKAAYMALALGLGLVVAALLRRSVRDAFAEGALLVGGFLAALAAYAIAFGGANALSIVRMVFTSPLDLAFHAQEQYVDLQLHQHVERTLLQNVLPYLACAAGLAASAARLRGADRATCASWVATVVLTALVFTHNQPWPYVFVMALPALAPWGARLVALAPEGRRDVIALAAVVLLAPTFARNYRYATVTNAEQAAVMRHAEALLGEDDRYFDGIGMLGLRRQAARAWWDRPTMDDLVRRARRGDFSPLDAIRAEEPKVVILSYRTAKIWSLLGPLFAPSYIQVEPSILLTGAAVESEPRAFECWWSGVYDLRDAQGRRLDRSFLLDGVAVRGPLRIERGPHRVQALPDTPPAWLLPADAPPDRLALGPLRRARHLFEGVYDF